MYRTLMMLQCIALFIISGCSLMEIKKQADIVNSAGILQGNINVKTAQQGSVFVVKIRKEDDVLIVESKIKVSEQGDYRFTALPGEYIIFSFVDVNGDGVFQRGTEHGNYHDHEGPLLFHVEANETVTVEDLDIIGHPPLPPATIKVTRSEGKNFQNIGKITSFMDPDFTRDNFAMGTWHPMDFYKKVGGGLYMLQPFQQGKMPVIFVHGLNGGPPDFKAIVEGLDTQNYQPWVLFYPSGFKLDIISDYLVQAVQQLKQRHGFEEFVVIAHSMGGLVARSFIMKYTQRFPRHAEKIKIFMTINSPFGGIDGAATAVKYSPITVPAWTDVATKSEFLKNIVNWNWPENIPYYLMFSYNDGADDGVVALKSQIPLKLQKESVRLFGFTNDHVGTLGDHRFLTIFNSILAKYAN